MDILSMKKSKVINTFKQMLTKTEYVCAICGRGLFEISRNGRILNLFEYLHEELCYCRDCDTILKNSIRYFNENMKWVNMIPKDDIERASQLSALLSRELIILNDFIKSNYGEEERRKARKAYKKNCESLFIRQSNREILI